MFSLEAREIDHFEFCFVRWSAWFYFISVFIYIYLLHVQFLWTGYFSEKRIGIESTMTSQEGQSFQCENINQIWLLWRHSLHPTSFHQV